MIYLDTHVVVWLFEGKLKLFPAKVKKIINNNQIIISPVVLLELKYLHEVSRISNEANAIFENLHNTIELQLCKNPFELVIAESILQDWTRDPFDRIIVAQAAVNNTSLITKDNSILDNYTRAVW